jgi:hypothetical protein
MKGRGKFLRRVVSPLLNSPFWGLNYPRSPYFFKEGEEKGRGIYPILNTPLGGGVDNIF